MNDAKVEGTDFRAKKMAGIDMDKGFFLRRRFCLKDKWLWGCRMDNEIFYRDNEFMYLVICQ